MTDAIVIVGAPHIALAARLDEAIAALSFDATGIRDARDFAGALHPQLPGPDLRACPKRTESVRRV